MLSASKSSLHAKRATILNALKVYAQELELLDEKEKKELARDRIGRALQIAARKIYGESISLF